METRVARPTTERITRRVARLEELVDSDALDIGRRARLALLAAGGASAATRPIIVRSGLFTHFSTTETGPTRIQQISTSKGAALKVLLLALFEAQVRKESRTYPLSRTRLLLEGAAELEDFADRLPSWVELAALPTVDSTTTRTHPRKPAKNRIRQIKAALDRLEKFGRVELGAPRSHGRYDKFRLLNEAVINDAQRGYTKYTVPNVESGRARRKVTTIPLAFFLNGWIDALTDNEIITYLILRFMAQAFPVRHAHDGVFLSAAVREQSFGLDRGFEAHRMLSRYGLIRTMRDPRRSARGTMQQHKKNGDGQLHHFSINNAALQQEAVPRVVKSLQRFAEGLDSDLASFADIFEQKHAGNETRKTAAP